jgi:hypothetical protein
MTTADVVEAVQATTELIIISTEPVVHAIIDFNAMQTYPPLSDLITNFKVPPRSGWSMVIGLAHNPIARFFVQVLATSARLRHRHVQSLAEALDFLHRIDPALPDLQSCHLQDET